MATESPVIDAFTAAIAANDSDKAEPLHRVAEGTSSPYPEKDLLDRAITVAVRAGSRATGESPRDSLITSGDAAFIELDRWRPWPEDGEHQTVIGRLKETLELATDELGPLRGGRMARFKDPSGRPNIVPEHHPSHQAVIDLARSAGVVVGLAGAAGAVDSVAELRGVVNGCPICGADVAEQEAYHQQIVPGEGPVIVCGECQFGHLLEREKDSPGSWQQVRSGVWAGS